MKYSVGLDIGGTKCAVSMGAVTADGIEIKVREEFPTAGRSWQEVCATYVDRIQKLQENFDTLMGAVIKARPAAQKGQYIKSCVIASTMGPGIKINASKLG